MSLDNVFRLVRKGDVDGLTDLFSTNVSIELNQVKFGTELTPLMLACNHGNFNIAKLLLKKGATIDWNGNGYSALMKAVIDKSIEIVKFLIKHGAQADLGDHYGKSPLCEDGDIEMVKILLEGHQHADETELQYYGSGDLRMSYPVSCSPFNTAVRHKQIELVKWFLESRKVPVPVGALFVAIDGGENLMVQILLDNGAKVNETGDGESSALMLACYYGDSKIVEMLLKKNAKVNYQNGKKVSALMLAANEGKFEVVKQLLEEGADVSLEGELKIGSTALLIVLSVLAGLSQQDNDQHNVAVVKLMLEKGAVVDAQEDGEYLISAVRSKSAEIIKLLLEKGAVVNQRGIFHQLSYVIDSPDIVQLLLNAGFNPNTKNDYDETLLMKVQDPVVAQMLVTKGADVNLQNNMSGEYALMSAVRRGKYELAEFLLEKGANATLRNDMGKSAADWVSM